MNNFLKLISVFFFIMILIVAGIILMIPAPCSGQVVRETWQPPEKIMDAIGVKPGMRVGEAGAGRGYFTFPLARRVGSEGIVYANDISTAGLDMIRNRALRERLENIKTVMGEVEDPLFPEKNLDMVVMVYVLHMLERPIPFLKNLRSYIRSGGLLVIIERNTTVERAHAPSFMTNRQILATVSETGYELDRTETFLPRDTIYIYKTKPAGNIHDAAAAGDLDKVKELLEADPSLLESKDNHGNTPLNRACFNEQTWDRQAAVAKFLIHKSANVNTRNHSGTTPLIGAFCGTGADFDLIQNLIANGADIDTKENSGLAPIHHAAWSGDLKIVRFLIDHGADINVTATQSAGSTPLLMALMLNSTDDAAEFLVKSGAKLNQKDPQGNTELHLAAMKGFANVVRLLAEHGADVHAVNDNNRTALYYAAKHGYQKAAEALIAAGADEGAIVETNYGKAPQLYATLKQGEAYLWYVHGGYAIKTKEHLLLFGGLRKIDESLEAGLANGHLNPNELSGQKITLLSSYPGAEPVRSWVFEFAKRFPKVNWVFSQGNSTESNVNKLDLSSYRVIGPHENLSVGDVRVHTIAAIKKRSDMGYLFEADGVKVFFGGAHVCSNQASEVKRYRQEIDSLKPIGPIDIAILRGRGHFNNAYEPYLYLIDQLSPKAVYLMGCNGPAYGGPKEYIRCAKVLRTRNVQVRHPEGTIGGDRFHYLRD